MNLIKNTQIGKMKAELALVALMVFLGTAAAA